MFLYTVYIYLKNNIIINKTLHMFRVYILPARYMDSTVISNKMSHANCICI